MSNSSEVLFSPLNLNLKDKVLSQSYSFDLKIDGFNNNKVIDSKRVLYINTIFDYLNNVHPIHLLGLQLKRSEFFAFRKLYTNDLPILKTVYLNVNATMRFEKDPSNDISNTTFESYNNFLAIVDNIGMISDEENIKFDIENKIDEEPSIKVTLALFEKDTISPFNGEIINDIFPNIDINSLIYHGFSKCVDSTIQFFANPSDNTQDYKQIIVEPCGFYDMLKFIDDNYGIYKSNYSYFFYNSIFYLFPRSGKLNMVSNKPKLNSELNITLVDERQSDSPTDNKVETDIISKYTDDNKISISIDKGLLRYDIDTYNPLLSYFYDINDKKVESPKKITDKDFYSTVTVRQHKDKMKKEEFTDKHVTFSIKSRPDIPIFPNTNIIVNNIDDHKVEKYRPVVCMKSITSTYCIVSISAVSYKE